METDLNKEIESLGQPVTVVDFIRHGEADYSKDDIEHGQIEGDLTERGKRQIEDAIEEELTPNIDPNKEVVVMQISPKRRAQLAAEIIIKRLAERGITVLGSYTRKSLSDVNLFGHDKEVDE